MIILYSPGFSTINGLNAGVNGETTTITDNFFKNYSTTPAPDLNIPMVKDIEENLKEQLLKATKYPLPHLIFTLCIGLIFTIGALPAWSVYMLRRRSASRLYLTVSILRI